MKIYVGSDHAGFKLKENLKPFLKRLGYSVEDVGNLVLDPKDDYPDFAFPLAKKVGRSKNKGILFCGSSQGVCIAANKVKGVRAVAVNNAFDAKMSREHNDANVLCLSGWKTSQTTAKNILRTWLKTRFSSAKRHVRRVNKIKRFEK